MSGPLSIGRYFAAVSTAAKRLKGCASIATPETNASLCCLRRSDSATTRCARTLAGITNPITTTITTTTTTTITTTTTTTTTTERHPYIEPVHSNHCTSLPADILPVSRAPFVATTFRESL